ncbi:putative nucleotide-utilizing enzyme [Hoeflea phototrophica DFL-43]|jgi:molybdenum cofactor synthesis domain-containing protein|uniref:Putative nucleotide-utilizing enzyme n=1 Tax=Hoeflea phototrophica (strain DSM 17068 / NCIMB 14078 / DFL-43) TaxID=411684 RepID=A9D5W3_HOEPD|nr:putative nucleotide-utilizing enzyme [Hoeflea phototrophica DFL-43]
MTELTTTVTVTASALAIGDELLSGRTKDKNIGHLAEMLTAAGIDLLEVRIVPDDEARIVEALNALRARYDYVFTSGGIGPTHDDITADAVAKAFGVNCGHDPDALALLSAHYAERGLEFTEARRRMARMPEGSRHIANPVSCAPGFIIGNVHVMAGVPSVFQAMLDNVLPTLNAGTKVLSDKVSCPYGEGDIGDPLSAIAKAHPDVNIGSYPRFSGQGFSTEIVIRGRDESAIGAARIDIESMLSTIRPADLTATV